MSHAHDVFLSHAKADKYTKLYVRDRLQNSGLSVWIDETGIQPGEDWRKSIEGAIDNACCVVVILTPNSVSSRWVRSELAYADAQDKPIYSIMAEDTNLSINLMLTQYSDLRTGNPDVKLDELAQIIKRTCHDTATKSKQANTITSTPSRQKNNLPGAHVPPITVRELRLARLAVNALSDLFPGPLYRACLFLLDHGAQQIYVASASPGFRDAELGLRFAKGQGIVGESWARMKYSLVSNLEEKTEQELRQKFLLDPFQIAVTKHVAEVMAVPIFSPYQADRVIGILALDSLVPNEDSNEDTELHQIRPDLEATASYIAQEILPHPLPKTINYRDQLHLESILRVARLLPPLNVPTQATVYLVDDKASVLYAVVSSEPDLKQIDVVIDASDNPTYRAWQEQSIQFDHTVNQFGGQSLLAVPILTATLLGAQVLGVLVLKSSVDVSTSQLGSNSVVDDVERLANLIGKILSRSN